MASPSELSLDCKPHSYSMLMKSFAEQQYPDQTQKLEEFLSLLEEERLKIDAFKRELPLCMQLLTNAVESSRQQLHAYRANNTEGPSRPILEEFIPLKTLSSEGSEKTTNTSDKANWMTSAQLWSQNSTTDHQGTKQQSTTNISNNNNTSQIKDQPHDHISFNVSPNLALDIKLHRNNNGSAFLPFSKDRVGSCPRPLPELALSAASAEKEAGLEDKKSCLEGNENGIIVARRDTICGNNKVGINGGNNNGVVIEQGKGCGSLSEGETNNNVPNNNTNCNNSNNNNNTTNGSTITAISNNNSQTNRKARRCWSPDLHRRFVTALQMLGGSQVATPKQIRDLMKVDGLTNDEVKSHLQKYRLHTRRPSPSRQVAGAPPQLLVLGGIWVPPEYASAAAAAHSAGPAALYPAAHAPPHYCGPAVPQDFFAAAAAAPAAMAQQLHHHHHAAAALHHHHQLQLYNNAAAVAAQSSPESDVRGGGGGAGGDQSESIEDGKSESSSWNKGESGDNAERKGLAALREDGEESNGSDITLKF